MYIPLGSRITTSSDDELMSKIAIYKDPELAIHVNPGNHIYEYIINIGHYQIQHQCCIINTAERIHQETVITNNFNF